LAAFLRERAIDAVIDATHPFAAQISDHAARTCQALGIPRLYLRRAAWPRHAEDRWVEVGSASTAATILPGLGPRVFLTSGQQDLDVFERLDHLWFLIRTVEPISAGLPNKCHCLVAKGPFTEADETQLLQTHQIDVLVTKASGGDATNAKIAAARKLGLPVLMIKRPKAPSGATVETVDAALTWLQHQVA
jgi:precorrin-6A/cobalt-precorrin-6A reductase